jgi:uncharacterized protein YegL
MNQFDLTSVEFANNPEPRCPCVLLLDTSYSMLGPKIDQLNAGLASFQQDLMSDNLAMLRVEVGIVTFGGRVDIIQDFVTAGQFAAPYLSVNGNTPMGQAINTALNMIDMRKQEYKANGIAYFRPWVFLITDGEPTDNEWPDAARRVRDDHARKRVSFFAVGVQGADMSTLTQIAPPDRPPLMLDGLKFRELFSWLSRSLGSVSRSQPGDEVPLQSPVAAGWTTV